MQQSFSTLCASYSSLLLTSWFELALVLNACSPGSAHVQQCGTTAQVVTHSKGGCAWAAAQWLTRPSVCDRVVQVLRDQLSRRAGPGGEALIPSLQRALADLQERLIYRCATSCLTSTMRPCVMVVLLLLMHALCRHSLQLVVQSSTSSVARATAGGV